MADHIDKAAAVLADTTEGWVTRRDAAEYLGNSAGRALAALHAHRKESDTDVRMSIDKALAQAKAGLEGITAAAEATDYTLEQLARCCEKTGKRTVSPDGNGFVVDVQLKNGRGQRVYLEHVERKDGHPLIRVSTRCGKPDEGAKKWALQANAKLVHCALALWGTGDDQELVLVNCFFASEVTPPEIKAAVKEISYYGDWIEQKLSGQDEF